MSTFFFDDTTEAKIRDLVFEAFLGDLKQGRFALSLLADRGPVAYRQAKARFPDLDKFLMLMLAEAIADGGIVFTGGYFCHEPDDESASIDTQCTTDLSTLGTAPSHDFDLDARFEPIDDDHVTAFFQWPAGGSVYINIALSKESEDDARKAWSARSP